jgi:CheY-like chemotaxis protein
VLVIDDDPALASSLRRLLGREHHAEVATSGRAALELLERGARFEAIVCDVAMPDFDGVDVHGAIERLWPQQARRMVFVTGGTFTARCRDFLERVPNPRLEKPFDGRTLLTLVRSLVQEV